MVNWLWRRVGEVLLPQPHVDLIFAVVLQQHLRCGVSGWKGWGSGNQPAATVFFNSMAAAGRELQSGIARCQK